MISQSTSTRVIITYKFQVKREANIDIDLGDLMKLFNQCNFLTRYLTEFNYVGLNLNETPEELENCTPESQNFSEKEFREHSTNKNCLICCE